MPGAFLIPVRAHRKRRGSGNIIMKMGEAAGKAQAQAPAQRDLPGFRLWGAQSLAGVSDSPTSEVTLLIREGGKDNLRALRCHSAGPTGQEPPSGSYDGSYTPWGGGETSSRVPGGIFGVSSMMAWELTAL